MTLLEATPAGTSTGPAPRTTWRRNRLTVGLVALLVLVLAVLALVTGVGAGGALDPRSYQPAGARALATLLGDQGVRVVRTGDVPSTLRGASSGVTVFVPQPELLSEEELQALAFSRTPLVVVAPGPGSLRALAASARVTDRTRVADHDPGCVLAAAGRAGRARTGGLSYRPSAGTPGAVGCYPAGDGSSLLQLPARRMVLVGSGDLFSNDHLDEQGDAALALGLLGERPEVRWLVPAPDRAPLGQVRPRSANDLLPHWVRSAAVQGFVALGVLALWRARRLGRVVPEPLPVVVRAAEAVEGRGRLYRAAGSRDTAAEALRAGARDRLAVRVGAGRAPAPEVLVDLVAAGAARSPAEVQALLYGAVPADDAALVALADDLDRLTEQLTRDVATDVPPDPTREVARP